MKFSYQELLSQMEEKEKINKSVKDLNIKQNEIWMVNLGNDNIEGHEQKGSRPFYVISSTRYNFNSKTPIGFFLTTSKNKIENKRLCYSLDLGDGNKEGVLITQIRTLSEKRFSKCIGIGKDSDLNEIINLFQQSILAK